MKWLPRTAVAAVAAAMVAFLTTAAEAQTVNIPDDKKDTTLVIEVGLGYESDSDATPERTGTVVLELLPDVAPQHVERLKALARQGFYDGVVFHRVIEGFMAQTGDPTGTGRSVSRRWRGRAFTTVSCFTE